MRINEKETQDLWNELENNPSKPREAKREKRRRKGEKELLYNHDKQEKEK